MAFSREEEIEQVARILAKKGFGEKLTQVEENILAYSPYGYAAGCSCGQYFTVEIDKSE